MKMCTSCQTQYRDGDLIDKQFCTATPMMAVTLPERFHSGNEILAENMVPTAGPVCGTPLRDVNCLVCLDSGEVEVMGEKQTCHRGCVGFGQ